jgi:hypothetical protein
MTNCRSTGEVSNLKGSDVHPVHCVSTFVIPVPRYFTYRIHNEPDEVLLRTF